MLWRKDIFSAPRRRRAAMPSPERERWARLIDTVERSGDITARASAVLRRRATATLGRELANVEAVLRQATIAGRDLGASAL